MCKALEDFEKNAAEKGAWEKIVSIVSIKLRKGKSPEQIADELEESLPVIEKATADTEKDARTGHLFLYASCSGGCAPPNQEIT